jgi:hypothetical protein
MKKLLLPLIAVAALATPASAFAHHGHGHHGFWWHHHHTALLAKLSGTGASLANPSAAVSGTLSKSTDTLGSGTFAATVTTDWTKADTRTGDRGTLSCAPSTAALTLTGATATNTLAGTLSGKTCKWTPTGGQTVAAFFGRGAATGAGALANLTGSTAKAFLWQKADGTTKGAVFVKGMHELKTLAFFSRGEREASHKTGDCDHDH